MIKKIDKGYSFNSVVRYGGGLLLIIAIYNLLFFHDTESLVIVGVFLVSGLIMVFAKESILIDYKDKVFVNQLNILGLKYNKKNELSIYRDISIISRRFTSDEGYSDNSDRFYETQRNHTLKHDLVFLTPKHLGRLLISQFDDYDEALELGKVVSKYTGKPLVKYAPQRISKKR